MTRFIASLLAGIAVLMIAGCATEPSVSQNDVNELALAIQGLGPSVDPNEAERAARIAYTYSAQLKKEYNVTSSAIVHNAMILNGLRERGLCNDWAEDVTTRLKQEHFKTLTVLWATSPPSSFHIIHHSAVIATPGDTIYDGIILDPWRYGGALFWSQTRADDRYDWRPRMEVREELLNGRTATNPG